MKKYNLNYAKLVNNDVLNGPGFRSVLFLTGCSHKCLGCYNKSTWNPCNGQPFTEDVLLEIINELNKPFISGVTITGGDPLFKGNLKDVEDIIFRLRRHIQINKLDKTIWLWTGYTLNEAIELGPLALNILHYIDVIIDGKYEQNNPTRKPYRGSDNQRLWKKENGKFIEIQ